MTTTTDFDERLDSLRTALNLHNAMYKRAVEDTASLRVSLEEYQQTVNELASAIELCRVSLSSRANIKKDIEELVTLFIQALFDEHYRFEFVEIRDDTDVLIGLKPTIFHYDVPDDPKNYGGGVRNGVSFGTRLLFVVFRADLTPTLLLDEPNVNLDTPKWDAFIDYLFNLQKTLKFQVIVITHSGAKFPQTFMVRKPGKTSIVEQLI